MSRAQLSLKAHWDLEEIWLYIAQDSPRAADRLIGRIHEKCQVLAESPHIGRSRPELAVDLRSFPVGNYVIFYPPFRRASKLPA